MSTTIMYKNVSHVCFIIGIYGTNTRYGFSITNFASTVSEMKHYVQAHSDILLMYIQLISFFECDFAFSEFGIRIRKASFRLRNGFTNSRAQ